PPSRRPRKILSLGIASPRAPPPVYRPSGANSRIYGHSALIPPKMLGHGETRFAVSPGVGGPGLGGRGLPTQLVQAEAEEAVEGTPGAELVPHLLVEPQLAVAPLEVVVSPDHLRYRLLQEGDHLVELLLLQQPQSPFQFRHLLILCLLQQQRPPPPRQTGHL